MKTVLKITTLAMVVSSLLAVSAIAQPAGSRPEFKPEAFQLPSVDEAAQKKADIMNEELALSEKQYKKVLKLFKSQIQEERDIMQLSKPDGMPDGFPGGRPSGGGPGMGGGRPPMGGPGPQGGFGGPGMAGERPPMGGHGMRMDDEEVEKMHEKYDKKLKKILSEEQYSKWRTTHPVNDMPLPKVDWFKEDSQ